MIFLLQKTLQVVVAFFVISFFAFILVRLAPGDPVLVLVGERGADPQTYKEMQQRLGLDKPPVVQYALFVKNLFSGDWGISIVSKESVLKEFFQRLPATLELAFMAFLFGSLIGVPLGIFAAIKRNTFWDYSCMSLSLLGYSMPIFWWGPLLILFFSITLGITPVSGRLDVFMDIPFVTGFLLIDTLLYGEFSDFSYFFSALSHLLLTSMAMGTVALAFLSRMTRANMIEVLGEDYVKTAKAKGLPFWRVVIFHGIRNASIPLMTSAGLLIGQQITGALLTETIFSWPGIGKWLVKSVEARDYPVVQGGIILIAGMIIFVNFIVDLLYYWADPRLRK